MNISIPTDKPVNPITYLSLSHNKSDLLNPYKFSSKPGVKTILNFCNTPNILANNKPNNGNTPPFKAENITPGISNFFSLPKNFVSDVLGLYSFS